MKRRTLLVVLIALTAAALSACGGSVQMAHVTNSKVLMAGDKNKATLIFSRPSEAGKPFQVMIYDITDGDLKFIGTPSFGTKMAYTVPGRKKARFLATIGYEHATFLDTDMVAGRTYHVSIVPRVGVWRFKVMMVPVLADDPSINEHTSCCNWVENTPETLKFARDFEESGRKLMTKYLAKWELSTDRRILGPDGGL